MEIFSLHGSIAVDNDAANKSISDTDKKAGGLAEKLGKVGNVAKTGAKLVAGVGAAAVAGGAAMLKLANDAAGAADAVDKGAIRMGINTTQYQEMAYAAGQSGVEMGVLEKAAKKLEGTDINFNDAIRSIMAMETAEERAAKASELFGDAVAYQMSPLIEQSSESFYGLIDNAHELGIIMSEDAVAAGVKMGDTLSDVKQAFGAIITQLGSELMPVVQKALDWVIQHMPEIRKAVGDAMEYIKQGIVAVTPLVEAMLPIVEKVFQGCVIAWNSVLKPMLDGIITFLTGVFTKDWDKAFQGISKITQSIMDGLVMIVRKPVNKIIEMINNMIQGINGLEIPDWVPVVGGASANIPTIPYLAKGGNIAGSGVAVVGEAGAELVEMPSGARVTPLGSNEDISSKFDTMIDLLQKLLVSSDKEIVLDTGALVGATVSNYDSALGRMQRLKIRR